MRNSSTQHVLDIVRGMQHRFQIDRSDLPAAALNAIGTVIHDVVQSTVLANSEPMSGTDPPLFTMPSLSGILAETRRKSRLCGPAHLPS